MVGFMYYVSEVIFSMAIFQPLIYLFTYINLPAIKNITSLISFQYTDGTFDRPTCIRSLSKDALCVDA